MKTCVCVHARLVIAATFWNLVILYSADQSYNAQDDKNNLTAPSTGNFKKAPNPNTLENIDEVCAKNSHAARCYPSP